MKVYEKPVLNALSISGNDLLCAACAVDIQGPHYNDAGLDLIRMLESFGIDPAKAFGSEDGGCEQIVELGGYCKFNGANVVFNS